MRIVENRSARCAIAVVVLSILPASAVQAAVIDGFTDVQEPVSWPALITQVSGSLIEESGLTDVMGGERTTSIDAETVETDFLDFVIGTVAPSPGVLDFNSTVGAKGAARLMYDGMTGLGADLSGDQQAAVEIAGFDLAGGAPMDITFSFSDGVDTAELTRTLVSAGAQTVVFPFAEFNGIADVDLSDIQSIEVAFAPETASDFRVSEIRTELPEPGMLGLLAVGGGLVALLRSRRRG